VLLDLFSRKVIGCSMQSAMTSDYRDFLSAHNLTPSMSRRGHCLDNAVAESFFHSLKTERVKRKVYVNRSEARADLFDDIEMFYNS
jgi:putative transposase